MRFLVVFIFLMIIFSVLYKFIYKIICKWNGEISNDSIQTRYDEYVNKEKE